MRMNWAPSLGVGDAVGGSLCGALTLAEDWPVERLPWGVGLVSARGLWSGPGKGTPGERAPSLHGTIALLREGCFGALGGKT